MIIPESSSQSFLLLLVCISYATYEIIYFIYCCSNRFSVQNNVLKELKNIVKRWQKMCYFSGMFLLSFQLSVDCVLHCLSRSKRNENFSVINVFVILLNKILFIHQNIYFEDKNIILMLTRNLSSYLRSIFITAFEEYFTPFSL